MTCLGPAFVFVLTESSHFHCGHGMHDSYHTSTVRTVFHSTGVLFHFWDQWERFMLRLDRRNAWRIAADIQNSPLPHCCSLPSVLLLGQVRGDELLWGDESWASCDCIRITQLHFTTVQFVSRHVNTFRVFSFGNLYYLE